MPRIRGNEYLVEEAKNGAKKIILSLKGTYSASATKTINQYMKVYNELKQLQEEKKKMDELVKPYFADMFSEEDAFFTRVIKTQSVIIEYTADTQRSDFDKEKFLKDLAKLEIPTEIYNGVLACFNAAKKTSDVSGKLKVKELQEGLGEILKSAWSKISSWFKSTINRITNSLESKTRQLERLTIKENIKGTNMKKVLTESQKRAIIRRIIKEEYPKALAEIKQSLKESTTFKKIDGVVAEFDGKKFITAYLPQGMSGASYKKWRNKNHKKLGVKELPDGSEKE